MEHYLDALFLFQMRYKAYAEMSDVPTSYSDKFILADFYDVVSG